MIGYGLVNSAVHEICLNQIIVSFLSRSSVFLANFYLSNYIKQISGGLSEKQKEDLFNLFLEEEKYIAIQKNQENPDENFNEEEIIYKYLLTANIVSDKDYNFDLKTTEQVIGDGRSALKNIFFKIFEKFLGDLNQNIKTLKLPSFPEREQEFENFLLNIVKYSTFISANNSVATRNKNSDNFLRKVQEYTYEGQSVADGKPFPPITTYGTNVPDCSIFGDIDYAKDSWFFGPINRVSYLSLNNNEFDPKKIIYNYFTTSGKFFNYGDAKPLFFGEFYYTIKPEKIDEVSNVQSFTLGQGKEIDILSKPGNDPGYKENLFIDFQRVLASDPNPIEAAGAAPSYLWYYNFKNLKKLGYFDWIDNKSPMPDSIELLESGVGYKRYSLSIKEILKFYKFSFTEVSRIVGNLRNTKRNFEDYFDLNFRLVLNLNADISKNNLDWSNHPVYELFNIPFEEPKGEGKQFIIADTFNKYPPFYQNLLFNKENVATDTNKNISINLLHNEFFIDFKKTYTYEKTLPEDPAKKIKITEEKFYSYTNSLDEFYTNLLESPGLNGSTDPKDNPLFKMLFGKDGVVLIPDNYETPKLKINYLKTVADFPVNTKGRNIYFSPTNNALDSLFEIKKTYYETILSQLLDILGSNVDNDLKNIINSYKFDELKKLSEQLDNFNPTSIYRNNIKTIYDFYNKKTNVNLLTTRETAIKILDQQIKVLENG